MRDLTLLLQILVTGANGYLASHVIDQFLAQDYTVRGTVRNIEANKWLQDYFDKKYGNGKLTLVQVEDFGKDGCFDEAVKGMFVLLFRDAVDFARCCRDMIAKQPAHTTTVTTNTHVHFLVLDRRRLLRSHRKRLVIQSRP